LVRGEQERRREKENIYLPERLVFITNGNPEREADPGYKIQG
jgi:hypothetical protein